MKALYKFHWDCGRQGDVTGLFVEEKENIKNIIGKEVYFGEILGKHSEVYGIVEKKEITMITDEKVVVDLFVKEKISTGYNPCSYYNCPECGVDKSQFEEVK